MSSARFAGVVDGSRFSDVITDVIPDAAAESPQTEPRLSDPLGILSELRIPASDVEARREKSELLGAGFAWLEQVRDFLARCRTKGRAALVEQHEACKAAVREQAKSIEAIKSKVAELSQELARAQALTAHATAQARGAQQARESLTRFASREEIAKADERVRQADEEATRATENEAPIRSEINFCIFTTLHQAGEKLKELEGKERDVSLLLSGQEGSNSLGFVVGRR